MKRKIEFIIKKYETYVSNLNWHIDNNNPIGEKLIKIKSQIHCYNEMISDLRQLI